MVSSGELLYSPPDRLEKHTLQPEAESMIINGKNLTLVQGGQRRELRLPQYPEVEALVAALRGALAGSQALLQSHYALALAGSWPSPRWTSRCAAAGCARSPSAARAAWCKAWRWSRPTATAR